MAAYHHILSVAPRWALGQQETQARLNERLAAVVPSGTSRLFATTLTELPQLTGSKEQKNGDSLSVTLVGAMRPLGYTEEKSDDWLNVTPHCFFRNLSRITGGTVNIVLAHAPQYVWGALNIQDCFFTSSQLVIFNHAFPENTSKADKKNIREWAMKAALVVSFDKEVFDKYGILYGTLDAGLVEHRLLKMEDVTLELLLEAVPDRKAVPGMRVHDVVCAPDLLLDDSKTAEKAPKVAEVAACCGSGQGKSPAEPMAVKTSPKEKKVTSPVAAVANNLSQLNISRQSLDWHDQVTPTLSKFHDNHAQIPKKAIEKAMPFFEGIMKQVEGKLREKNLCIKFEYTGSAYERVMINENDVEFDLMVVMSRDNELEVVPFDDVTGGYFLLKPKEDGMKEYSKLIHSPEEQVISPEKVVNMFFSALQKALNEIQVTCKTVLRKHGPAVQMDTYFDVKKTQKWFSVDIVPAFQIKVPGEVQLFVAKPYPNVEVMNLSWRRSFSVEEKLKFHHIDKGDGCRRKCVRILKAIRKPPQSMNRKLDSSFSHLTSFMIKNALFHENEDPTIRNSWGNDKLGPRLIGLISRMAGYLETGNFPHFYLPGINIVAGMEPGPRANLENRLRRLVSSEIEFRRVICAE